MTEHYYSQSPQSKSSPRFWEHTLRGKAYQFTSDEGVFSKRDVDFGSCLLIEQFREPYRSGDILDLGCGYGPIGITLADMCENRHIVMADVNDRALELGKQNIELNDVGNVSVVKSDRFSGLGDQFFAAIVTNPPIRAGKEIVYAILEESRDHLLESGELWVVIQKKQGAPSAKKHLTHLFKEVKVVARSKGYYIFHAINA